MILSVFKSCRSVRTVLRNLRLNSYISSTRGVTKKKENVWFLKMPEMFQEKTRQQVENLKLVPEGYKLIYLSKDLKFVAVSRIVVFGLLAISIWIGVALCIDPELIVVRENFVTREQALCLMLINALVFYILATRHVHYIFRNENSYKTVYYGLFGKLQPRIIDHEAQELVVPGRSSILPFFYSLKGKPLIISTSGFTNYSEFAVLVKRHK